MKQSDLAELCSCFRRVASIIERIDLCDHGTLRRVRLRLTTPSNRAGGAPVAKSLTACGTCDVMA